MKRLLLLALLLSPPAHAAPFDTPELLMWQARTPIQWQALRAIGFTGAKLQATGGTIDTTQRDLLRAAATPFYLENIATDFYAPYHRYTPGKTVTWLMDQARAQYRAGDPAAFRRQPGLSDPAWLDRIRARLAAIVRAAAPDRPLFYNLGDESGIADLATAWDSDTAPASLEAFRLWLQTQYPTLDALNRQWGTAYTTWSDILPELTDAAIARPDQNFSAWSDFKAFMDTAFAAAVRAGTEAVHQADPEARAALEGAQLPGWGGYDYAQLAPAVDVMEIYDFGNALDLALAHNPGLIALRTSFGSGPAEAHAAWHHLLHGGRGTVVWDELDDVALPDGTPGPRGRDLAATHAAIAAAAPAILAARPDPDPVAVYVNQASFRIRWLLDRRAGDHDWTARDAEREYDDNAWRAARRTMLTRLGELGIQPRLVARLDTLAGIRVLLLPHAIALPDEDVAAIRAFRAAGGTVLADTEPGLFDGHGSRRPTPPLPEIPRPEPIRPTATQGNLAPLAALLQAAGAPPRAAFIAPGGQPATGIEVRWFRGPKPLLAIHTTHPWSAPPTLQLRLPGRAPAVITLDGITPTILELN